MADAELFTKVEEALHKAIGQVYSKGAEPQCEKLTYRTSWMFEIPKIISRLCGGPEAVNKSLAKIPKKATEVERNVFLGVALKALLDFEVLQVIGLMPPKGCPFEAWVCCAGPCKSGYRKSQNIQTLKWLRKLAGIQDNIPEDYYDKFEDEWRKIWNEGKEGRLEREPTDYNTPLILLPVRNLSEAVKDSIRTVEPGLSNSIDNLFLCGDHFKKIIANDIGRRLGFNERRISSLTCSNVNFRLETGEIRIGFAKSKHFSDKAHLSKLLMILGRGVSFEVPVLQEDFCFETCAQQIGERLVRMEDQYNQRSDYNNGYMHQNHYPQFDSRQQMTYGGHSSYNGYTTTE